MRVRFPCLSLIDTFSLPWGKAVIVRILRVRVAVERTAEVDPAEDDPPVLIGERCDLDLPAVRTFIGAGDGLRRRHDTSLEAFPGHASAHLVSAVGALRAGQH